MAPAPVLQTAITTSSTSVHLDIPQLVYYAGRLPASTEMPYIQFLHFANLEQQGRKFDIYSGNTKWYSTVYLYPIQDGITVPLYCYRSSSTITSNTSLVATNDSVLPPLLNAIEIYYKIAYSDNTTSPDDGTYTNSETVALPTLIFCIYFYLYI